MKSKLLPALIAAIGLGAVAAPAQAGVIASSYMAVSNLILLEQTAPNTYVPVDPDPAVGGVNIIGGSRNGQLTATLNGTTVSTSNSVGATATLDLARLDIGAGNPAGQNDSSTVLTQGLGNFASGDLSISGTALGPGATGMTRADASVLGPDNTATSGALITNNVLGLLTFTVTGTKTLGFSFDWTALALAEISNDLLGAGFSTADSSTNFSISVQKQGGALNTIETLACQATAFNVAGANSFANTCGQQGELTNFLTLDSGLYTVQITTKSSANVQAIPEPSSIALAGLGLLGIGASLRRRKQA